MVTPDSLSVSVQNLLLPYGNTTSLPHPQAHRCEVVINGLLIYSTPCFISDTGGMKSTYLGVNSVILIVFLLVWFVVGAISSTAEYTASLLSSA